MTKKFLFLVFGIVYCCMSMADFGMNASIPGYNPYKGKIVMSWEIKCGKWNYTSEKYTVDGERSIHQRFSKELYALMLKHDSIVTVKYTVHDPLIGNKSLNNNDSNILVNKQFVIKIPKLNAYSIWLGTITITFDSYESVNYVYLKNSKQNSHEIQEQDIYEYNNQPVYRFI